MQTFYKKADKNAGTVEGCFAKADDLHALVMMAFKEFKGNLFY